MIGRLKQLALAFDRLFEIFALTAMVAMTLIVTMQVITRRIFNFVFFWSEEVTLLLLIWFGFLGIAVGFREQLHLAMDSLFKRLPNTVQTVIRIVIKLAIFAFGLYLVIYGWQFTELMHANKLSATRLPLSIQYVVMPISGVMICIYALLQMVGIDTRRHAVDDEEEEEEEVVKA